MCNKSIRDEMKSRGVRQWQVAECMNISESLLSKMMRHELDPDTAMESVDKPTKIMMPIKEASEYTGLSYSCIRKLSRTYAPQSIR